MISRGVWGGERCVRKGAPIAAFAAMPACRRAGRHNPTASRSRRKHPVIPAKAGIQQRRVGGAKDSSGAQGLARAGSPIRSGMTHSIFVSYHLKSDAAQMQQTSRNQFRFSSGMKLGFEEEQSRYDSGSQLARVWTERWVADWMFCPNCGAPRLSKFPNNKPVADFYCSDCLDQFEVKGQQKAKFGPRVPDGAYSAKMERLASDTSPNLLLLSYDRSRREVRSVCVVPKHFFVADIIERRKPLAPTARRAGWVGSNILLDRIPISGRIFVLRDGVQVEREAVLEQWRQTLFLRQADIAARGWLIEVMKVVEAIGRSEFSLADVYAYETQLQAIYPDNHNVRPKIRQQLQVLRDNRYLDFLGRGRYRLTPHG